MTNTPTTAQCQKIFTHLKAGMSLTTLEARKRLGICHPAARALSFRKSGHDIESIVTRENDSTGMSHRVAKNLLSEASL